MSSSGGSGGGGPSLLAIAQVIHASNLNPTYTPSTAAAALVALDTTNLRITPTVPSNGKLLIVINVGVYFNNSGATPVGIGPLVGGVAQDAWVLSNPVGFTIIAGCYHTLLTGLTAGSTPNIDLGMYASGGGGNVAWVPTGPTAGAASIEAWSSS